MPDKSKFKFVNSINEDFKLEVDEDFTPVEIELTPEEKRIQALKNMKILMRTKRNKIFRTIGAMTSITGILFLLAMLWQDDWSLMAIGDGLWLVFVLEFFAGWTLLIYNQNIWSPFTYGMKSFVLMFLGKRPKTDYYTFMKNVQDNQISSFYYWIFFITSFIVLIPALITLFILT